jgi:hypothetical protein
MHCPWPYGVGMVLSSSLFIPCLSVCLFWNVGLTWFVHPLVHLYCMLACCKSCTSLGLGVRKGVRGGGRGGLLIRWGERGQIHPPCFHGAHISLSLYYSQLGMGGLRGGYKEHINPQPLLNYGMQLSCMWIFIGWGGHSL